MIIIMMMTIDEIDDHDNYVDFNLLSLLVDNDGTAGGEERRVSR